MFLLALAMTSNSVLFSIAGELEGTRIPSKSQNEVELVGTVRERSRLQQLQYSLLPHVFLFFVCYCSGRGIVGKQMSPLYKAEIIGNVEVLVAEVALSPAVTSFAAGLSC